MEDDDDDEADGSAEVEDSVGGWNEGGVASGSVVKRMPVDTVQKSSRSAFSAPQKKKTVDSTDDDNGTDTTSCALLLGAEVDLGAGGDPPFQTSLHRVLLVYPLHLHRRPAAAARRQRRRSGSIGFVGAPGRRGELAKVVEHSNANHAVLRAVGVLCAPATRVVLQAKHDVARRRRGAGRLRLPNIGSWIGNGSDEGLEGRR